MAKIKFSALVTDASGSVGGNIFSRNASGPYVKSFTMPHNPNTQKQQDVRAAFAVNISAWKNLTKAQQQLWIDAAPQYPYNNSLGEARQYTGQQLYNKLNQNLYVAGQAAISTPLVPKTFSSQSMVGLEMSKTAGVLTLANVELDQTGSADEALIVSVTTSLSGGITRPGKGLFKQVIVVPSADADENTDFTAEYLALYGTPETGTTIFVRVDKINKLTGQRIHIGQASTVVTDV
jgi:hypothetical protein